MVKKPRREPVFSLSDFSRHRDVVPTLLYVAQELGRLGSDEYSLPPYQRELYEDLQDGLDEEAISEMHRYWLYDLEALSRRRRGYEPEHVPAKPRIDILLEITSKGNFKAEWFPRGWNRWGAPAFNSTVSDFKWWTRFENRDQAYDSRPSNELFFLHGVQSALCSLGGKWDREPGRRNLDQVLLHACSETAATLRARLDDHFEIRMLTEVFVKWHEPKADCLRWEEPPPVMVSWEIDDPEVRQAQAERALLARLEDEYGFSADLLVETWNAETVRKKRPTGPAPSPHTIVDRVTRALKAKGAKATAGQVERAMGLLRKHQTNVVPIRGTDQAGDAIPNDQAS